MKKRIASKVFLTFALALAMAVPFLTSNRGASAAAPLPGAIFTTNAACDGTDLNIYASKEAVYVDGGPAHPGAAGLPDGEYYIKVTAPDGTLLGTSLGTADETPVVVVGSEFQICYQLFAIVITASDGTQGYDDTPNAGGEYKVWVSMDREFTNNTTKTDNFKVKPNDECQGEDCEPQEEATLRVIKFYDANANGINDDGQAITGWKVNIKDGINVDRFTPANLVVAPDDYIVSEYQPIEASWLPTTPTVVQVTLADGDDKTVEFGNVCLGAGGGLTLGFWSNKNGKATMNDGGTLCPELTLLNNLCLRDASGTDLDFGCDYNAFRNFLLNATAVNMANMLSAQLAAMELNVEAGFVSGASLIYAPGTTSANAQGFATISAVLAEAEAELCAHGFTPDGSPDRAHQEALKNALDKANNNKNFVQATPCPFSFAE